MGLTSSETNQAETAHDDARQSRISELGSHHKHNGWTLKRSFRIGGILLVLSGAAVVATGYVWDAPSSQSVSGANTVPVEYGAFTVKISELGVLRALDSVSISATKDLPIIWLIPEGSTVKKGDVVIRFDASKYDLAYESAQASVEVAKANQQKATKDLEAMRQKRLAENSRYEGELELAQMALNALKRRPLPQVLERAKGEFQKAQLTLEAAERQWKAMPNLLKLGYIEGSTFDDSKFKVLEAKLNLSNTRLALEQVTAGATIEELKQAQIRLKQAQTAVEKAKRGLVSEIQSFRASIIREQANVKRSLKELNRAFNKRKRRELRAPRDGLVVFATDATKNSSKKIQLGMIPFEGQRLIELPNLSTMVVDTDVNEFDIGKVKVGARVKVRIEAFPDTVFDGEVHKIGALARFKESADGTSTGVKAFNVIVQIKKQDSRLKPGLTANLDIISFQRDNAISVPLVAVTTQGDRHFVRVANANEILQRPVVLGPNNETRVIVEEGLREGDRVVLDLPNSSAR